MQAAGKVDALVDAGDWHDLVLHTGHEPRPVTARPTALASHTSLVPLLRRLNVSLRGITAPAA